MIIHITPNILKNKILSGDFTNKKRFILRIKLNTSPEDFLYIVIRLQFPVRLYFNMTVNKSQRQSFNTITVDLQSQIFFMINFILQYPRLKILNNYFF